MRDWIMRSWFRHPLSLRPFCHGIYSVKGVTLIPFLRVRTIWDEGWHANTPLDIELGFLKWTLWFGIKDSN